MTFKALAGALLMVGALAGCGADDRTAGPTRTSPTPSPSASIIEETAIDGTFTVTYSVADVSAAGITEHEACENAGEHRITLTLGRWTFEQTPAPQCGSVVAGTGTGTYAVAGDVVTFTEPGAFGCSTTYAYRFRIAGNTLTFQLATDDCEPRRVIFTTKPWTRTT